MRITRIARSLIKYFSKYIYKIVLVIGLLYLFILLISYFYQEKLIFYPQPIREQVVEAHKQNGGNVEELSIRTSDENLLNGWLVNNTNQKKSPLVIYFGGNSDEVSYMISESRKTENWAWALVNYRGFGASTGTPNEENLFKDSLAIYDHLSAREDIDNEKIIVFGRSLGTGVAMYVAQNRKVQGAILATPYDSITSVAQEKYPLLPITFILRNNFDSLSRAEFIEIPVLIIAAKNDEVIPIAHTERLAEELEDNCDFKTIENTGHETISDSPLYFDYINQFLKQFISEGT